VAGAVGRAYVGTSGFAYKEWRPGFYPEKTPEKQFLPYYASKLAAVEIDYTFYRMPSASTLDGWVGATPDGFKFSVKASQKITHFERLRLPSDALTYLLSVVPRLGDRLGAVLWQLPPNFKRSLDRLEPFLAQLPRSIPSVFEFRHESWFVPEVYRLLESRGVGLVINDGDDGCTPVERTAPLVYLRLRRARYADAERAAWCERIRAWAKEGNVLAFVKHEENPDAPLIAMAFAEEVSATA
jgi:uncharacterized protein YecE (DUF72 family)